MGDARGSSSFSNLNSGSVDHALLKPVKIEKGRRAWSVREEEIFLSSLKELVAIGWKTDNGFKGGYGKMLEIAMQREFPGTDIREKPHINSKLTTWKKNYSSLVNMLSLSGAGFNARGDFLIDLSNDQWEHVMKVDTNEKSMRNKTWPYFDEWNIIFGKDRANGDSAEGLKKAVNELDAQEAMGNTNTSGEHSINVDKDDITGEEDDTVSVFQENGTNGLKRSDRKRKGDDSTNPTFQLLSKMHADTTESLKSVSSRIGYEIDLSNK
ncbi:uncharacterized protein LOC121803382 [Salvia splendens]|uniref:uncharacterized protein LOC121803382 n=1 Tax=Salvia splendens TaxID=180675 RepID=UPI001C269140|nr:uncharacterized protein LOC121803382 [Salvia splendens]